MITGGTRYYLRFFTTGKFNLSGSIMSLVSDPDETEFTFTWGSSRGTNCFYRLFYNTSVVDASALSIPATVLPCQNMFNQMFYGCQFLTHAPALPAKSLYATCYQSMFEGCSSLTHAPALKLEHLDYAYYYRMFSGCSSLSEVHTWATDTKDNTFTQWLSGASTSGVIYNHTNSDIPTATDIPAGWRLVKLQS